MMFWKSLGRIYAPENISVDIHSHAALPTVFQSSKSSFKIYFSVRDVIGRSHCTFVDLDLKTWRQGVLLNNKNKTPSLSPGPSGHFDDSGVSVSTFFRHECHDFALYLGWTRRKNVPFANEIGIALLCQDYSLKRLRNTAVYGRSETEPLTFGYPTVICNKSKMLMYYDGIDMWNESDPLDYKFDLRVAEMSTIYDWIPKGKIKFKNLADERAVTRPSFFTLNKRRYMIFSSDINGAYNIAAACLMSGNEWVRLSDFEFQRSGADWDSCEAAYPTVFKYEKNFFMIYNGSRFGATGFGLAKLCRAS